MVEQATSHLLQPMQRAGLCITAIVAFGMAGDANAFEGPFWGKMTDPPTVTAPIPMTPCFRKHLLEISFFSIRTPPFPRERYVVTSNPPLPHEPSLLE
jgi:hypothetical protein